MFLGQFREDQFPVTDVHGPSVTEESREARLEGAVLAALDATPLDPALGRAVISVVRLRAHLAALPTAELSDFASSPVSACLHGSQRVVHLQANFTSALFVFRKNRKSKVSESKVKYLLM